MSVQDMIPTVGFNMRKITKGNVTIKLWDIGGQPRFRSMWERYCRGVNAIVYMVDAADPDKIEVSNRGGLLLLIGNSEILSSRQVVTSFTTCWTDLSWPGSPSWSSATRGTYQGRWTRMV